MSTPFDTEIVKPAKPATERSAHYACDLMRDKAICLGEDREVATTKIQAWLSNWPSQEQVSETITRLKGEGYTGRKHEKQAQEPATVGDPLPTPEQLPEGRYALPTLEGATNEIAFYELDHGKKQWVGRIFVERQIGGTTQRLGRAQSEELARRIMEFGPAESSMLYGKHIGRCGVCHITLTNDESRARGIGPICAEKLGW